MAQGERHADRRWATHDAHERARPHARCGDGAAAGGHHAHLRQLSRDPTHTTNLRRDFERDLGGRFREIRGLIRRWVGYANDILGLTDQTEQAAGPEERVLQATSTRGKALAFARWLARQIRKDVLERVELEQVRNGEHWTAQYVRGAYGQGWRQAVGRLKQAGVATGTQRAIEEVFGLPVPERQLTRLYSRAYENLKNISTDTSDTIRQELTEGVARGQNPRKIADRVTKEVRGIENTRATVLARTEVINSHAQSTLDRYEQADIDGVTVSGEFATADDARVCPICEALEGETFGTEEMRKATFTFEPSESEPDHLAGDYPVRPPVHPQCRCAILPVVN